MCSGRCLARAQPFPDARVCARGCSGSAPLSQACADKVGPIIGDIGTISCGGAGPRPRLQFGTGAGDGARGSDSPGGYPLPSSPPDASVGARSANRSARDLADRTAERHGVGPVDRQLRGGRPGGGGLGRAAPGPALERSGGRLSGRPELRSDGVGRLDGRWIGRPGVGYMENASEPI